MFFAIDYDSRSVECKHPDRQVLSDYVSKNKLENAVAIVGCESDILELMSVREMNELNANLANNSDTFNAGQKGKASKKCWEYLTTLEKGFPKYTAALGKRLVKEADKRNADKEQKPRPRLSGKTIIAGDITPTTDVFAHAVIEAIEDSLGEIQFEDLVSDLCENCLMEESEAKQAIKQLITNKIVKAI